MATEGAISQSTLGSSEANSLAKTPIIAPSLPLLTRLAYGVRLWAFKFTVLMALKSLYVLKSRDFSKIAPTRTKAYYVRPGLYNRIFIPRSYDAKSQTELPLFLDIHGGGFALCDPKTDDRFCHRLANAHNMLVISVNYRKAPYYPFPIPVHDCAEIIKAILDDDTLPIDKSRVCLGGFSAGGNLALAVASLPELRSRIQALLPVYPVVDFSMEYKGTYKPDKSGAADLLRNTSDLFNWGYVSAGVDRTDIRLSPIFATREELPQKRIFFIGCEFDVLCHEAEVMAQKLAGVEGQEGLGPEWTKNGIKWWMVRDQQHGFTHTIKEGKAEEERKAATEEFYKEVGNWLEKEVINKN